MIPRRLNIPAIEIDPRTLPSILERHALDDDALIEINEHLIARPELIDIDALDLNRHACSDILPHRTAMARAAA
jgi:hypothetical protein